MGVRHGRRHLQLAHRRGGRDGLLRLAPTRASTRSTPTGSAGRSSRRARSSTRRGCSTIRGASTSARATACCARVDAATGAIVWTFQADEPPPDRRVHQLVRGQRRHRPDGHALRAQRQLLRLRPRSRPGGTVRLEVHDAGPDLVAAGGRRETGNLYVGNNNLLPILGKNTYAIASDGNDELGGRARSAPSRRARSFTPDGHGRRRGLRRLLARLRAGRRHACSGRAGDARPHLREPRAAARRHHRAALGRRHRLRGRLRRTARSAGRSTPARPSARRPRSTPTVTSTSAAGDGNLYVLNPDGSLRCAMKLIDDAAQRPQLVARARGKTPSTSAARAARCSASRTTGACAPRTRATRAAPRQAPTHADGASLVVGEHLRGHPAGGAGLACPATSPSPSLFALRQGGDAAARDPRRASVQVTRRAGAGAAT